MLELELYCYLSFYLVPIIISWLFLIKSWKSSKFASLVSVDSMETFIIIAVFSFVPVANWIVTFIFFALIINTRKFKFVPKHLK